MASKTTRSSDDILPRLHYIFGILLAVLFGVSMIPFRYYEIAPFLFIVLTVVLVISLLRGRVLNLFLELVLVGMAVGGLIPFAGYIFRVLGFVLALLELASLKHTGIYQQMYVYTSNRKRSSPHQKTEKKSKQASRIHKENVQDAEFKEK